MPVIARHLVVAGRVQGVFFRNWTVATAETLGLAGWVRNRRDGGVEIMAVGERAAIDAFVAHCHEGPPAAKVASVAVREVQAEPFAGFARRPTA